VVAFVRYAHVLYLALALLMFTAAMLVYAWRSDLRRPILIAGTVGMIIEVGSDLSWYLQDYWRPPTVLPWPVVEDLFFGFGVTALAVCAVPVWCLRRYEPLRAPQDGCRNRKAVWGAVILLLGFAAAMTLTQVLTDINSILAATLYFLGVGVAASALRRDIWWVGPVAGLIMALVAFIGYFLGLDVLIDGDAFLRLVYLPYGTSLDVRVPGTNVLVDELAWFFARGWCIAAVYPLLLQQRLRRL
jgi:hypothetical protein